MLIIRYTYEDKKVELPLDLKELSDLEDPKEVDEWDLLNYVASKVQGEIVDLTPIPSAAPRGGNRPVKDSIGDVAFNFGFSALQLIDNDELAVFIV